MNDAISGCTLRTRATADDAANALDRVDAGTIAAGTVYPYLQWDLSLGSTCGSEPLVVGADTGPLITRYTGVNDGPTTFPYRYQAAPTAPPAPVHDGASASNAADTCAQLHTDFPALTSGLYWIDPDGANGTAPFRAWCEMTLQGGGWTLFTYYKIGNAIVTVDPVDPGGAFGVAIDTHWVALRNAMTDGMMFVDDDGAVSRITAAVLRSGNCTDLDNEAQVELCHRSGGREHGARGAHDLVGPQADRGVAAAKQRGEPPRGRGLAAVEEPGLGEEKGRRTAGRDLRPALVRAAEHGGQRARIGPHHVREHAIGVRHPGSECDDDLSCRRIEGGVGPDLHARARANRAAVDRADRPAKQRVPPRCEGRTDDVARGQRVRRDAEA